jgi:hypothetical protein
MPVRISSKLTNLRQDLYLGFTHRRDAVFNIIDALSADGCKLKSVISLSSSKFFPRQYSSITDGIDNGLCHTPWDNIQKISWLAINCKDNNDFKYHRFVVDASSNPRPFSSCLGDRTIVHTPNPTPGNKPIGVGHQYSVLAYLPPGDSKERKTWIAPVDVRRVLSTEKSHELGVKQAVEFVKNQSLEDELSLLIDDSAYGTSECRSIITSCDNLIQIFRMRNNRIVFKMAQKEIEKINGRPKIYGSKFTLNSCNNDIEPDYCESFAFETKKGKTLTIKAECYEDMIFKGTKDYKASEHPFRLVKYTVFDENGISVFKRPLWIAMLGKRRKEISINEGFTNYMDRYDIEHFFRFTKNSLLMNKYQSPDYKHEEVWWKLVSVAYLQLYFAREDVISTPEPWERYLEEFKDKEKKLSSPSQTQRGFNKILQVIGTPAKLPVPRGNPTGRICGKTQEKRKRNPVIFKNTSKKNQLTEGLNKATKKSKPKKKKNISIKSIIELIKKSGISCKDVSEAILAVA